MTRNLFDQYKLPENRLTHALLSTLTYDRRLLSHFLRRYVKGVRFNERTLEVAEQTMPGDPEPTMPDNFNKSLPDGVIFERQNQGTKEDKNRKKALIIESKINSRLTNNQLVRHSRGVRARGFAVSGLAITPDNIKVRLPDGWSHQSWSDIYDWLIREPDNSIWRKELAHFVEALEVQMLNDNSLGNSALTRFNGIPFERDHPYTYQQAKRLIRLLRAKLEKHKAQCAKLGIDLDTPGKAAITQVGVWDYFSLHGHPKGKSFTFYPHLTFGIGPKSAEATITVPNAVRRDIIEALQQASLREFQDAAAVFLSTVARNFKAAQNVRPMMKLLQRRYQRQNSPPIHDAILDIDVRTAVNSRSRSKHRKRPKFQPEWLNMAKTVISGKASNLQFQIGCQFDYERCAAIHERDAEILFVSAWLSARDFFKKLQMHI
jgi:hypothetical protein